MSPKNKFAKIVGEAVDGCALVMRAGFDDVDQRLAEVKGGVKEIKSGFNKRRTSVDAIVTDTQATRHERVSTKGRLDRHEKWIESVADKVGVKLEY